MNRIQQLATTLGEHGHDVFVAQTPVSLGYLAGFPEDGHERFLALFIKSTGESRLICPALSAIQAERVGFADIRSWRDGEDPLALFEALCHDWNLWASVLVVDDHLPSKMLLGMQSVLTGALFKPGGDILALHMGVKDADELAKMHAAGALADAVYQAVLPQLREGQTELEIEAIIRNEFRNRGGNPTFCIVGINGGAAESHHINGSVRLAKNDLVLMDFGCELDGYNSDITRTVCFGTPSDRMRTLYDIVYRAHQAAVAAVRVGAVPSEIDAAARKVIEDAGFGDRFTHRTGHGIGLRVHEAPNISPDNHTPLVAGNCFSIEPGIYLSGELGVRLENLYTVDATGAVAFNAALSPEIPSLEPER